MSTATAHDRIATPVTRPQATRTAEAVNRLGVAVTRYALAVVMIWIGAMKFTTYEAEGIKPFVTNSPLMSWLYSIFSVGQFSALLGVAEIAVGVLIALRAVSPAASAVGSFMTVPMFLGTLSFIITTPGWEPTAGGFPALSLVGQFLLKDLVLLGAAVVTGSEAVMVAYQPKPLHGEV